MNDSPISSSPAATARARLVVLASGNGSNLQAILDACASGRLPAEVVAVVSDRPSARALERAASAGVPGLHVVRRDGEAREGYDARLADLVSAFTPDWIVLAGWMRILTISFLGWFPEMVVNLHPALPGELPGTKAIERAFVQAKAGQRTSTGVTVHLVPDAGVDTGPTLATAVVPIESADSLDSLTARMHAAEHELLVATLVELCTRTRADTAIREVHADVSQETPQVRIQEEMQEEMQDEGAVA